ncbi:MAG TPA: L-threonylcarbamoyladenylate synthase [Chitinophagales bacterium]|nr:L-threonylcarbamoyladenylate synthase [Chitinophagales bacterium]
MSKIGNSITESIKFLEDGGLVGIPTETVYGLAANGLDAKAVLKIFAAKKRPSFDPLILHSTSDKIFNWVREIPAPAKKLAEAFWPGPLTLILPKSDLVPFEVTSGLDTVGVRVPNHELTLELLQKINFPLAAPSANPFGYISPTTAQHVNQQLGDEVDYILDGGACDVGIESTIVGFENNEAIIYRLGGLSVDEIEAIIGKVKIQNNQASNPKAPGMIAVHYAPKKPLILVNDFSEIEDEPQNAYLIFGANIEVDIERQFFLSSTQDYYEAAAKLYAMMRHLDESKFSKIIVQRLPDIGLGKAINDRLFRASVK